MNADPIQDQPALATLDIDFWELDDGEVRHASFPSSFWIPDIKERKSLQIGDSAKLRFMIRVADENGAEEVCNERMWVRVEEAHNGFYLGTLENQPECTPDFHLGQQVWFEPRHIIDIVKRDKKPN